MIMSPKVNTSASRVAATEHSRREVTPTQGDQDVRVVRNQFGSSELYRRFMLPRPTLVEKVTARLEKGVLHISAPCAPKSKAASGVKGPSRPAA
jgi:HSP20 family molecular chaperone IbpA